MSVLDTSDFVLKSALLAGFTGVPEQHGASTVLRGMVRGRAVEIGTNGSFYWVAADLSDAGVPRDAEVVWAPVESYDRAKHLEEPPLMAATGDTSFDSLFLILGPGAASFAGWLRPGARAALVTHQELRPRIGWLDLSTLKRKLHVRCEPSTHRAVPGRWYEPGTGTFTAERAASVLSAMLTVAAEFEGPSSSE